MGWQLDGTIEVPISLENVSDNLNPTIPGFEHWGIVESDEIRDIRWKILNKYSYERQIKYNPRSEGSWTDDWIQLQGTSDFDQTWSD